jgi:hypothetical protein
MRSLLLLALAACGGDDECMPRVGSRLAYQVGNVASGAGIGGVSWIEQQLTSKPLEHVAILHGDGTLSPDIPSTSTYAVSGTRTVLWHRDSENECASGEKFEFAPLLYDGTDTTALQIAAVTRARTAVFDGTRYQLFWSTGKIFHQTLDEDGTLGPVHDLGLLGDCVRAASDGAGTTFFHDDQEGFILAADGTKRLVWSDTPFGHGRAFYFAGEFHIAGAPIWSIDPIAGTSRKRTAQVNVNAFYPSVTKLYGAVDNDVVELDASFAVVARTRMPGTVTRVGTLRDDLVFLRTVVDVPEGPKRIVVERGTQWSTEIAVDSPTETLDACP